MAMQKVNLPHTHTENLPAAHTNFIRFRGTSQAVTPSRKLWCSVELTVHTLSCKCSEKHGAEQCRLVILTLQTLRQEASKFEASLVHRVRSYQNKYTHKFQEHGKDNSRVVSFSGPCLHAHISASWKDQTPEDLNMGLAQPLGSYFLITRSINHWKKYRLAGPLIYTWLGKLYPDVQKEKLLMKGPWSLPTRSHRLTEKVKQSLHKHLAKLE